jgi:hypothetical protein
MLPKYLVFYILWLFLSIIICTGDGCLNILITLDFHINLQSKESSNFIYV